MKNAKCSPCVRLALPGEQVLEGERYAFKEVGVAAAEETEWLLRVADERAQDPAHLRADEAIQEEPAPEHDLDVPAQHPIVRRVEGAGTIVQILPWEYGALPRAWVEGLRANPADEVWTPTEYCRAMFLAAGIAPERIEERM